MKAQCEEKVISLEGQIVPLRRELEQLRTQTYGEGKFAETFRRIEEEKKDMKQKIEDLEAKYDLLRDDFTVSEL